MSLADDILKQAGRVVKTTDWLPEQKEKAATPKYRKTAFKWHNPNYGVQKLKNGQFRARPRRFGKPVELGSFNSLERASIAVRLFKYWADNDYGPIPKPPYGKY